MTAPAHLILETLTLVAPFGIGLWDPIAARLVTNGLSVHVFRLVGSEAFDGVEAVANRSGVFVPHDLFGPRAFAELSTSEMPSPPERFLIAVRDPLERYTSFVMRIGERGPRGFVLPLCMADMALPPLSSPPIESTYVPLFATASRLVPAGMAAVRASIIDARTDIPAEFALLDVREAGRLLGRGIADKRGEAVAVFAYPEVAAPPPWSPPGARPTLQRLVDLRWTLDVSVRFRRNLPRYAPGGSQPSLPELCDVLTQPVVTVFTSSSPPMAVGEVELRYGEELVLGAEAGVESGARVRAELLIDPA